MIRQGRPNDGENSRHGSAPAGRQAIKLAVRFFGLAPTPVRRTVVEELVNQALRQALAEGDLEILKNRIVLIEILDVGIRWSFTVIAGKLVLLRRISKADVTIRGNLWEFILLATRRCDPDTLFFERRLCIEGDTELGLAVKNTLDALDDSQLPTPLRFGLLVGAKLVDQFS